MLDPTNPEDVAKILPLVRGRVKTLAEITQLVQFLFHYDPTVDFGKSRNPSAYEMLVAAIDALESLARFESDEIERELRSLTFSVRQLYPILREAVTQQAVSPPIGMCMEVLGRAETLKRLQMAALWLED